MKRRVAIVIAVDGLRASALGAYGNTSQATPALDALASQSVVVEWMLCTSPELSAFYDAAWGEPPLSRQIVAKGGAATLITDDPEVAERGDAAGFANVLLVELPSGDAAETVADTAIAKLFAVAAELIADRSSDDVGHDGTQMPVALYWVHTRGLNGPWDAPPELRASQLEEDDPAPPTFTEPPAAEQIADHDALLSFQVAYAAQIAVLDECVDGLLEALGNSGIADDSLVALIGTSGFALGEHGVVGSEDRRLFTVRLHVPCLLRAPKTAPAPPRWSSLATPRDLQATLARWLGSAPESELSEAVDLLAAEHPDREHVIAHGRDGEHAIRTLNWMLRISAETVEAEGNSLASAHSGERIELYVKPDDRWEANEVAALCPDDVERLTGVLRAAPQGSIASNTPRAPA
jgi:arylsulfatase A-like enzyme